MIYQQTFDKDYYVSDAKTQTFSRQNILLTNKIYIEISKYCMFETQQFEHFGTLVLNHTYISFFVCYNLIICVTNTRILVHRQNVRLTIRHWDLGESYGLKRTVWTCLVCSFRSLLIIYKIPQVSTPMINAISWVLRITCGFD